MKYRKKPVVVDAIQFEVDSIEDLINFVTETTNLKILEKLDAKTQKPIGLPAIIIDTLEGMMTADLGDWIVKGVEGEFADIEGFSWEFVLQNQELLTTENLAHTHIK